MMREPQEYEGFWFSLATPFSVSEGNLPNSIGRVLSGCNSKPNLSTLQLPPRDDPRKTRGQNGFAVLLSCRALSSHTTCRFSPAHYKWRVTRTERGYLAERRENPLLDAVLLPILHYEPDMFQDPDITQRVS